MPQRNVASNFTFEQQRVEINNLAQDFWTQKGTVDTAAPTYLKHDGSNDFTGQSLAVPNAFTINSNSGNGTVTISGNLDVTGTTTTVSSANLEVTDKNILIAKGSTSDAQADGAGITIDSATDITFNFVDAKDALVSSVGLEGTTFLKAPYGHFIGSGVPSGGQGVEINAPDTNTGQIISYDRANTAYKELRVKGSSVGVYAGTANTLVGSFSSTGLAMESGKTITGDLTGAASQVALGNDSSGTAVKRVLFSSADTGNVTIQADTSDGITYKPSDGTLSVQKLEGTIVTAAQASITSVGTLTGLTVSDNVTITNNKELKIESSSTDDYVRIYAGGGTGKWDIYGNGTNLRFSDNDSAGSVVFDRDVTANGGITLPGILRARAYDNSGGGGNYNASGLVIGNAYDAGKSTNITDDRNAIIWNERGLDLDFATNDTFRMKLTYDGKLLLGTTSSNTSDCVTFMDPGNAFMSLRSDQHADNVAQHIDFIVGTNNRASGNMVGAIRAMVPTGTTAGGTLKGELSFWTNEGDSITEQLTIKDDGDVLPGSDNAQDLGASNLRWANVYTGDMHLNNMNTGGNEVDGSEGHWTMQEGADDLFLINRNTGKKYKFNLTEVS